MVFAKDMAYYLSGRLATTEFLPKGFTHTFLLRDPRKSAYSLYKMSLNKDLTGTFVDLPFANWPMKQDFYKQ